MPFRIVDDYGQRTLGVDIGDADRVVEYLKAGHVLAAMAGMVPDFIAGDGSFVPGGFAWLTDGEWLWGSDLAYYLSRYGMELPDDFLARVRAADYVCPPVSPGGVAAAGDFLRSPAATSTEVPQLAVVSPFDESAARELAATMYDVGLDDVTLTRRDDVWIARLSLANPYDGRMVGATVYVIEPDGRVYSYPSLSDDLVIGLHRGATDNSPFG